MHVITLTLQVTRLGTLYIIIIIIITITCINIIIYFFLLPRVLWSLVLFLTHLSRRRETQYLSFLGSRKSFKVHTVITLSVGVDCVIVLGFCFKDLLFVYLITRSPCFC